MLQTKMFRIFLQFSTIAILALSIEKIYHLFSPTQYEGSVRLIFSIESSIYSIQLLVYSTLFFTILIGSNTFLSLSNKSRTEVVKLIDVFWYPLGVLTIILGVYSAQSADWRYQKITREQYIFSTIVRQNSLLDGAETACVRLSGSELTIDLYLNATNSEGHTIDSVDFIEDLCSRIYFSPGRRITQSFKTSYRNDPLQFLIFESCERHIPKRHLSWAPRHFEVIQVTLRAEDNAKELVEPMRHLLDLCTQSFLAVRSMRQNEYLNQRIGTTPDFLKNHWTWIAIVCVLAGLKISKAIIEIMMLRYNREPE